MEVGGGRGVIHDSGKDFSRWMVVGMGRHGLFPVSAPPYESDDANDDKHGELPGLNSPSSELLRQLITMRQLTTIRQLITIRQQLHSMALRISFSKSHAQHSIITQHQLALAVHSFPIVIHLHLLDGSKCAQRVKA